MSRIQVETYVRTADEFRQIGEVTRYEGDCQYVQGAISLVIDGSELLGFELWDDVNWLWPFIVQAIEECRRNGTGRRGFPDQPISFKVGKAWGDNLHVAVTDGDKIHNTAVVPEDDLVKAVAHAGLEFFAAMARLCPGSELGREEREVLDLWLA